MIQRIMLLILIAPFAWTMGCDKASEPGQAGAAGLINATAVQPNGATKAMDGTPQSDRFFDLDKDELKQMVVEREPAVGESAPPGDPPAAPTPDVRMVIYTANLAMEVTKVEESQAGILTYIQSVGGYMKSSTLTEMVLRVPAEHFMAVVEKLNGFGRMTGKDISSQDVGEEFTDLKIRLENMLLLRERFMDHMKSASKMEDILAIEEKISAITSEIEQVKGRIKYLQDQTAMSTITIHFNAIDAVNRANNLPARTFVVPVEYRWVQTIGLDQILKEE